MAGRSLLIDCCSDGGRSGNCLWGSAGEPKESGRCLYACCSGGVGASTGRCAPSQLREKGKRAGDRADGGPLVVFGRRF